MDQGILEVTNYADEAEMEFQCSTQPNETHPGPWVFMLRQIKTLCQDISQESFWYSRHETFITSAKLIEEFHDCTHIKHEVNTLFQSHRDPQGRYVGLKLHRGWVLVCTGWMSRCRSTIIALSAERRFYHIRYHVSSKCFQQEPETHSLCAPWFTITVPWQLQH